MKTAKKKKQRRRLKSLQLLSLFLSLPINTQNSRVCWGALSLDFLRFSCRRYVGQPQRDGETRQIAPDRSAKQSFAASAGLSEGHPGKTAWIIHSSFRFGGGGASRTFRSLAPTGKGWVPGAERIYLPLSLKIEPASAFRDIILKSSGACSATAEHFRLHPVNWICGEHTVANFGKMWFGFATFFFFFFLLQRESSLSLMDWFD